MYHWRIYLFRPMKTRGTLWVCRANIHIGCVSRLKSLAARCRRICRKKSSYMDVSFWVLPKWHHILKKTYRWYFQVLSQIVAKIESILAKVNFLLKNKIEQSQSQFHALSNYTTQNLQICLSDLPEQPIYTSRAAGLGSNPGMSQKSHWMLTYSFFIVPEQFYHDWLRCKVD